MSNVINKYHKSPQENNSLRSRKSSFSGASHSETEEFDPNVNIQPISSYIDDREEMIEQIFSSISPVKLKKMLHPCLKEVNMEELKADCLIHLLGMSKKRILTIIEGSELHSSSDTESDSSTASSEDEKEVEKLRAPPAYKGKPSNQKTNLNAKKEHTKSNTTIKKTVSTDKSESYSSSLANEEEKTPLDEECELDLTVSEKEVKDLLQSTKLDDNSRSKSSKAVKTKVEPKISTHKIAKIESKVIPAQADKKNVEKSNSTESKKFNAGAVSMKSKKESAIEKEIMKSDLTKDTNSSNESKSKDKIKKKKTKIEKNNKKPDRSAAEYDDKGINLLEILELEMRAEAIRALLQNQDDDDLDVKAELLGLNDISNKLLKLNSEENKKNKPNNKEKSGDDKNNEFKRKEKRNIPMDENFNAKKSKVDLMCEQKSKFCQDDKLSVIKIPGCQDISPEKSDEELAESEEKEVFVNDDVDYNVDWTQRWLNSKSVVTTSKICANIRKRMKLARIAKQKLPENISDDNLNSDSRTVVTDSITGSVGEYYRLQRYDNAHSQSAPKKTNSFSKVQSKADTSNKPIILSDDDVVEIT